MPDVVAVCCAGPAGKLKWSLAEPCVSAGAGTLSGPQTCLRPRRPLQACGALSEVGGENHHKRGAAGPGEERPCFKFS